MDIAVVGSNMVDLISYIHRMPSDGETVEAPEFRMGCGGKGANQAVAASRLGAEVVMVTRVGNDVFADTTLDNFRKTVSILPMCCVPMRAPGWHRSSSIQNRVTPSSSSRELTLS